jgi:hypothetical protein
MTRRAADDSKGTRSPGLATVVAQLRARLYNPQITMAFPVEEVAKRAASLPQLPKGFSLIVPASERDFALWIDLLNEEPSFGQWTRERLEREILANMVSPTAASLILHEGRGIGCSCAIDGSTRDKRIAYGMYLYIAPKYRARTAFSYILTILALHHGLAVGYPNLWANTYPDRLSALAIYLSIGCRPVYRTLSSVLQWRNVRKRLGPAVEQMKRRDERRLAAATARGDAGVSVK